jgi:hypothetical protein
MISYDRAYLSRTEIAVFNNENQREGGEKPPRTRRRNGIARNGSFFPNNHCSFLSGKVERYNALSRKTSPVIQCYPRESGGVADAKSGKTTPHFAWNF